MLATPAMSISETNSLKPSSSPFENQENILSKDLIIIKMPSHISVKDKGATVSNQQEQNELIFCEHFPDSLRNPMNQTLFQSNFIST